MIRPNDPNVDWAAFSDTAHDQEFTVAVNMFRTLLMTCDVGTLAAVDGDQGQPGVSLTIPEASWHLADMCSAVGAVAEGQLGRIQIRDDQILHLVLKADSEDVIRIWLAEGQVPGNSLHHLFKTRASPFC